MTLLFVQHSPFSLSGPVVLLNTMSTNTLSLCSSLRVRDQVSHTYKTSDSIVVLCVSICGFLYRRRVVATIPRKAVNTIGLNVRGLS
jgi:hypothetical protein